MTHKAPEMKIDRAFVERLKADPANVAAQLLALTRVSDWARVAHRDNFDNYLVAAAELLTRAPCNENDVAMVVAAMAEAIDVADDIIAVNMGINTPKEWNAAFRRAQKARAALNEERQS